MVKAGGKVTNIALAATDAYADLTKAYALRYEYNLLAKNKLEIDVNLAGLLTSSKASTTGEIAGAFKDLGTAAGTLRGLGLGPEGKKAVSTPEVECTNDGTRIFAFDEPATKGSVCKGKIDVSIQPLWVAPAKDKVINTSRQEDKSAHSGIFYRQNRPYLVIAAGEGFNAANIVFAPAIDEVLFLPIARTVFTTNDAQITLTDGGVPSKYDQDTDGELLGLFKIPANIIGAYFDAIGNLFGRFSTRDKADAGQLSDALKLELAKQKYEACITAISAKNVLISFRFRFRTGTAHVPRTI